MKTCKLQLKNEGLPTQIFEIQVIETSAIAGEKVSSEVKNTFKSSDLGQISKFMETNGVKKDDLTHALSEFDSKGHNTASFGLMGGFIFSSYEGITQ